MKIVLASALWAILIFQTGMSAIAGDDDYHQMEDVVVSTSRAEVSVADAPHSVTVISEEEIMTSPFERVEDILRFSVGLQVTQHYGQQRGGIQGHLSMRGTGRNRVLMMLDGVPLNDNYSNSIAWVAWGLIPRESIERIEVLRGPSSASYGSEGMGGIVNIITKTPEKSSESSLRGIAGSGRTYGASGLHSQKSSRFGFLASGAYEDSDGFYMIDPEGIEEQDLRRHRQVGKGFGKVTYAPDERTDISLSGLIYDHEMGKGRKYFYDELTLDQYRLGINHHGDMMDWEGMLYLNRADKTAYQDRKAQDEFIFDRKEQFPENIVWGGEIQNTLPLFDRTSITTGLAYKRVSMDYEETPVSGERDVAASGMQRFISPFMDITTRFMNNQLIVNAGLRYDNVRNFDGEARDTDPTFGRDPYDETYRSKTWNNFSPKAGLVYHPDVLTTLRTAIVSGYRTPSLFELYKVHERAGGRFLRRANPDLDPETIVTWEIGGERVFFDNLWTRVTYYQSRVSDYIDTKTIDDSAVTDEKYDNTSQVDIHGIETELEYYIGHGLRTFFNYTYNISEVTKDEENPDRKGKYLTGDPRHKFRSGLSYENPEIISASILVKHDRHRYIDVLNTRKAPDFSTVDVSVWRTVFDRTTLRLTIENLTDEKEYIEDGRLYYGSIQFTF